jgi:hypothetical protein
MDGRQGTRRSGVTNEYGGRGAGSPLPYQERLFPKINFKDNFKSIKINIKGSGPECPLHNGSGRRPISGGITVLIRCNRVWLVGGSRLRRIDHRGRRRNVGRGDIRWDGLL